MDRSWTMIQGNQQTELIHRTDIYLYQSLRFLHVHVTSYKYEVWNPIFIMMCLEF